MVHVVLNVNYMVFLFMSKYKKPGKHLFDKNAFQNE